MYPYRVVSYVVGLFVTRRSEMVIVICNPTFELPGRDCSNHGILPRFIVDHSLGCMYLSVGDDCPTQKH